MERKRTPWGRRWAGAWLGLWLGIGCWAGEDLHARYYRAVFSGDLSWMLSQPLNQSDDELLQNFRRHFVERSLPPEFERIEDPLIRAAAAFFHDYWVTSLLDPDAREAAERTLERRIESALDQHDAGSDATPVWVRLADAIQARNWGFQGGRTRPLLDFMLWRTTESVPYEVELTDGIQPVTVHFLDDFVSHGWASFATFGRAGTGGWANENGLYCFKSRYDLGAEEFLVRYLKHEARHYADSDRFPGLEGADLEYRAKLTELAYADTDQASILTQFTAHQNPDSSEPHPLANWRVLNDLSAHLGLGDIPDSAQRWRTVSGAAIRAAARELLASDDERHISSSQ